MKIKKIDISFLRSKVAKRIFFLFIGCILLPFCIFSILVFKHVTKQLTEQSFIRIQQAAKAHGAAISERFLSLESDLDFVAAAIARQEDWLLFSGHDCSFGRRLSKHFKGLMLRKEKAEPVMLWGEILSPPPLSSDVHSVDLGGKIAILFMNQPDDQARIFLMTMLRQEEASEKDFLLAEVNPVFLWGMGNENILPPMTDLCIIDQSRRVLASSFPLQPEFLQKIVFSEKNDARQFEYRADNDSYLAGFWPLDLGAYFQAANIGVILRQAKSNVLAPLHEFKKIFPLAVLLSLWIMLLLSIVFIRRSLVPLEKLKEGTVSLARGDFSKYITVTSGDEFEDLARSFNEMAAQIDRQIAALLAISEINQTILSSRKTKEIIDRALKRLHQFFMCDTVCIILFQDGDTVAPARCYSYENNAAGGILVDFVEISPQEKQRLLENPLYVFGEGDGQSPSYLATDEPQGCISYLMLPLFSKERLMGMLTLSCRQKQQRVEKELNHARQIADQLSIALANASLVEELEKLNWGTLEALARTVDAKSPWTAGHSERVTELARKIALLLGCSDDEIERLQRAALIHDIGKIGIPRALLDKPDKLNDEEYRAVMEHPLIGARILEPIAAFADIIPIVLQHHERYDGSGYPHGLQAEAITLDARILAVVDMYDALISKRPYRDGWEHAKVVELIKQESGKQFDPQVVKAFLDVIS